MKPESAIVSGVVADNCESWPATYGNKQVRIEPLFLSDRLADRIDDAKLRTIERSPDRNHVLKSFALTLIMRHLSVAGRSGGGAKDDIPDRWPLGTCVVEGWGRTNHRAQRAQTQFSEASSSCLRAMNASLLVGTWAYLPRTARTKFLFGCAAETSASRSSASASSCRSFKLKARTATRICCTSVDIVGVRLQLHLTPCNADLVREVPGSWQAEAPAPRQQSPAVLSANTPPRCPGARATVIP